MYYMSFSLNSSERLNSRDLKEICSKLWEARIKWFNIGLGLNLDDSDLEAIRRTNRDNVDDCFMDMLKKWLTTSPKPTKSNLITVLREKTVGFNQLAEELESKSFKRESDRVINQLRVAPTKFMMKTLPAPSLIKYKSVIKIGVPILLTWSILFITFFSLGITYYYNRISPTDCYATGSGLKVATIGVRSKAVLHLVDQGGAAYTKQVNVITCEPIHEITGKVLDCEITWKANHKVLETNVGQYEISYQATSRGRHKLHIKVEGEHIKGSPFRPVTVLKIINGLKRPWGVAVNQREEIIVAERYGHCISIFSQTGKKLRWFGSEGSGPGQFNKLRGVTVDDDGNILVADSGNHRIQKFTSDNKYITSVGSRGSNHLQFDHPIISVAISPITKKIVISEWDNHRVQILNPDLTFYSSIGSKGRGNGQFYRPHDTAFDSAGNIYVTDSSNDRIQVFNPEGQFLRQFGKGGHRDGKLDFPTGISIDNDDRVYVVETNNHRVSVFTCEGKFLTSFGSWGGQPGQFKDPHRIIVDKNGKMLR